MIPPKVMILLKMYLNFTDIIFYGCENFLLWGYATLNMYKGWF